MLEALFLNKDSTQGAEQRNPIPETNIEDFDIHAVSDMWTMCPTYFLGACIDYWARKKVICVKQASTHFSQTNDIIYVLQKNHKSQKFFLFW